MLYFDIIYNDFYIWVSTYLRTYEHEEKFFEINVIFFKIQNFSCKVSRVVKWIEWSCKVSGVEKWVEL